MHVPLMCDGCSKWQTEVNSLTHAKPSFAVSVLSALVKESHMPSTYGIRQCGRPLAVSFVVSLGLDTGKEHICHAFSRNRRQNGLTWQPHAMEVDNRMATIVQWCKMDVSALVAIKTKEGWKSNCFDTWRLKDFWSCISRLKIKRQLDFFFQKEYA